MISIFLTLCTSHDIRFRITSRLARNPKSLRYVFERVARETNLDKLWMILIFYISIINWLSQKSIKIRSPRLPMRTHKNTKPCAMTMNRTHVSCKPVTLTSRQSVAQSMPSLILQTVSSQSRQFVDSVALRLRIKRILYYPVLRIQIRSWQ
jgi:hypothetical protein